MKKNVEKCGLANKNIHSADDLLKNELPASTYGMQIVRDCHQRPRENGGPASLPECREPCPFLQSN